jgi:flagellar biogenesis protein FliO
MVAISGVFAMGNGAFEFIWALLMFAVVLVMAYFATKFIGKTRGGNFGGKRNGNLTVIEGCSVGAGTFVQLIRVGLDDDKCRYYLIGVTKERITFITEVERDGLTLEEPVVLPFSNVFSKLLNKDKEDKN